MVNSDREKQILTCLQFYCRNTACPSKDIDNESAGISIVLIVIAVIKLIAI